MRILALFIMLSICSVDVFAEKKLKKSSVDPKPTSVVDVAQFIKNCISSAEIDEKLAHKCAINLDTEIGQEVFSQIKPIYSPQGKFEKSTEYNQRINESLNKWNGLHVIFEKNDPEVRYNQDDETLLINSDSSIVLISAAKERNEMQTTIGIRTRDNSIYEASNSFGKVVQVEKRDLLVSDILDTNYVDNLMNNIKFSMSIENAKKNLDDIALAYEVELVLRHDKDNVLNYRNFEYSEKKPTIDSPTDITFYRSIYFVRINKSIVFNKKTGEILAVVRR